MQERRELQYMGFLGGTFTEVKSPRADFAPCELAFDVAPSAKWILYGFSYKGAGKAWLRGGKVEVR